MKEFIAAANHNFDPQPLQSVTNTKDLSWICILLQAVAMYSMARPFP